MKKKLISVSIISAFTLAFATGCTTQEKAAPVISAVEQAVPSISEIDRSYLLSSDRLTEVDGNTLDVASEEHVAALKAQFENLKDGDEVVIPNGKYANLGQVTITANDITIKAEQAGSAWITGLIQFELKGDDITLDGLVFTEGGPNERFGAVRMMGNSNTLQNSTFYYFNHYYTYEPDERRSEYPKYLWVSLWGKDGKVINNRFEGKQKRGTLIGVQKDDTSDNHLIANNIFMDQKPNQFNEFDIKEAIRYNGNSWEAIRIGDSKSSQWDSSSKFVNNLMIDMDGERELISIKSGDNTISGNTIFQSAALISLRHGKGNTVENNMILGNEKRLTGGIRIYDEDHVIRNNYIANTRGRDGVIEGNADLRGGIVINTGIIDVANGEQLDQSVKGKELNKQWTPKNITIENNSLVDTEWGIVYGNQSHRVSLFNNAEVEGIYAGVDIAFKHNVVDNSQSPEFVSVRATQDFPLVGASYTDETYVGQVTGSELIESYSVELPKVTVENGLNAYQGEGADVSKLSVVTAETAGPDYVLENTTK
ncbi:polysaccharide lyase 6 family protein [Vibrio crassostreae]|uniref:polysaccharide lyase 6 family protein n=1 Tax=Vibrio crassostreae TaxID=246167 RepID=UPI0006347809|nr:polysaccharide lyase 6 family protein [Vibrio crassostreae]TCT50329.1 poly(beta-D-mannuronate) lyase [Vibrio crassostreae]TCT65140.1 poly(beta-D-mannuronate) lyase [Vibrio crassostreae]TCT75223.1 poly(beta-D-mannuronate) lyase [Vibrio crassostreae]TCT94352.1 poly(beta-D-mannuronate) lyase [Vibrio crassostreae]CAK1745241.1 poly(beta-D-mannuronate) lyase [Vibrio crassostreae]